MAKDGVNLDYRVKLKSQGTGRVAPSSFARNNMSKGGVNKDLGGGVKSAGKGKGK